MNTKQTDTLIHALMGDSTPQIKPPGMGGCHPNGQQTPAPIASIANMLSAQARAAVEARFVVAAARPRNWDDVRIGLLAECRRPAFAQNKSAYYVKPIGMGVEGLGIRFAEVAIRHMTNVLVESATLHDDPAIRMIRVSVTDLEANETFEKSITLTKTVERSRPHDDGTYLSVRTNSSGKPVYTVVATDDDLLNREGALVSKAIRTLALRIIPGDLQDECSQAILRTRRDVAASDPSAERKRIADAFAEINVKPSQISAYLGHDYGGSSPAELVSLRGIYGAIRDGEATWAAVVEARASEPAHEPAHETDVGKLIAAVKHRKSPRTAPKPHAAPHAVEVGQIGVEPGLILESGPEAQPAPPDVGI